MSAVSVRLLAVSLLLVFGLLIPLGPVAKAEVSAAPEDVIFKTGIEYANPEGASATRPGSAQEGRWPVPRVVCIHGGGFRAGKPRGLRRAVHPPGRAGLRRRHGQLPPGAEVSVPGRDPRVKAAVRWLRANATKYQIDPDRIGVTGGSAGGHLAQFLAVTADVKEFEGDGGNADQSSRVACVVNVYGPSDFTKSYGKSVDAAEVLPLWLGGDLEKARAKHIRASPLNWVTPNAAPTLCIHGTEDKYVAHEQAVWMIDR